MSANQHTTSARTEIRIGDRFERLVVIEGPLRVRIKGIARLVFRCECDCGTEKIIRKSALVGKRATRSCGCIWREVNRAVLQRRNTKHGFTVRGKQPPPEFSVWIGLRSRCLDPQNDAWHNYGGRGIKVCKRWENGFGAFYKDMGPRPSSEHSIDRINNDGHYSCGRCPECKANGWRRNCQWATRIEQANNTRRNVSIEHDGNTLNLSQWSRVVGIDPQTLSERIEAGWKPSEALSKPPRSKSCLLEYNGEFHTHAQWSRIMGISRETLYYRLRIGWSLADALTTPPHGKRKAQ